MEILIGVVFVAIMLFGVLFIPVGLLCTRTYKSIKGVKSVPLAVTVNSYLPLYSVTYIRKILYGRSPVFSAGQSIVLLLLLFRVVAVMMIATVPVLTIYSAFGVLVAFALFYVMYIVNAIDITRMLGGGALLYTVSVLLPPLAYYMLAIKVLPYFSSIKEEVNGTFSGKNTAR